MTAAGPGKKSSIEVHSDALVSTSHRLLAAIREANSFQLASVLLEDFNSLSETQAKKLIMTTQVPLYVGGALGRHDKAQYHSDLTNQVEILRLESSLEK